MRLSAKLSVVSLLIASVLFFIGIVCVLSRVKVDDRRVLDRIADTPYAIVHLSIALVLAVGACFALMRICTRCTQQRQRKPA